jgi:hypothetical protein
MADRLFNIPINASYPTQTEVFLQKLREAQNTNLSTPAFTQGVTNIDFMSGQNGVGYVSPSSPTNVNIFPYAEQAPQILAHEIAHTQAMLANKRRPQPSDVTIPQYNEAKYKREEGSNLQKQLIDNYKNYIETYVQTKGTKDAEAQLGGYFGNKTAQYDERIADLQSLEAKLPKGQTLLDTPLGKEILNTPELQNYWRQTVTPLDVKALPNLSKYEKPFWIKSLEKLQTAKDTFTQSTRANKSYADSAVEAIKTLSPFYKDPFGDTTK